jgi:hypothetical protein
MTRDWNLRIPAVDRRLQSRPNPDGDSVIRRICTGCLRGYVHQDSGSCGRCGAELRELAEPMRFEEFKRLSLDAREDLQTRRITAPKTHPDVLPGDPA